MKYIHKLKGMWKTIYRDFGMDDKFLSKQHMKCPFCGGKDRFRFTDYEMDGWVYCNQCLPDGLDGISFLMRHEQILFNEINPMLRKYMNEKPENTFDTQDEKIERNKVKLRGIYSKCETIQRESATAMYLANRTGFIKQSFATLLEPKNIFHCESCPYYDKKQLVGYMPAMVCIVRNPEQEPVTLHITYLTQEGTKADIEHPKKIMPTIGNSKGGGIVLRKNVGNKVLIISEGVENLFAGMRQLGFSLDSPCDLFVGISANGIKSANIDSNLYHEIIILVDNDKSFTGQAASYSLANALWLKNRDCQITLKTPKVAGEDWCDVYAKLQS